MVTYLACFIICDFKYKETTTSSGKPFRVYSAPDLVNTTDYALEVGSRVLDYFEEYFKIAYPLPKMDMIAIPDFSSGAMEHWGLITYRETNLLYDAEKSSPQNKQRIADIIAHEMTHMWFGNLMTMEWWDDLWLNEGFASYMEYKGVEHQHPEWNPMTKIITTDLQPVMIADSSINSHPIVQHVGHPDEITEIFDRISYAKGASILRMLEFFVGEKNFRTGISNFLKKHEYKNAKTSDLWEELSNACGYQGNRSISSIMKTWTEQMGFPYITITRRPNSTVFIAKQKPYLKNAAIQPERVESIHKYVWSIPLSYMTSNGKSGIVWIHEETETKFDLPITNSEWVKFNVNQTGYYLVNYESHDWKMLIEQLLTNPEVLTPSDRSNLLFDSFMLAQAGHIGLDVFLSMSTYLKREMNLTPWQTASTCFGSMAELLKNTEADLLFKSYVSGLVDDVYKTLGWNSSNGHTENLLRTTVMSLACSAGHEDCLTQASERFNEWMKGNEISVPLKNVVFKYGISSTSVEENWNYMWNKYLTEQSPTQKKAYLTNLGNVKIPHLITRYLEYAMDETKVRSQDFFTVLNSEMENPVGRPIAWNFVREKWPALVERFTLNSRYLGNFVNRICSTFTTERELQEMQEFFAKYPDAGAGRRGRLQALETVQYNIHWIKTHASEVGDWLLTEIPSPWRYYRLPNYIIPEHYDLTLYPMLDKDIFNGTVTITVALRKPSEYFLVHSEKLNISQTKIICEENSEMVDLEDVFEYKENNFLVLKVKRKLPVGKYKLHFEFQGPFMLSLEGLYKSSYVNPNTGERRYLASTQFEAVHARKAFPCFDEPAFRSTFTVSVIHNTDYFALSNTKAENTSEIGNGLLLTKFEKTVPMVTYLLCIVVCDFKFKETVTDNGVKLRVYTAPHYIEKINFSLEVASKVLTWYEKYFDVPFPLKKIDMIAVPDFGSNGMENWGLVTYSEESLICEKDSSDDSVTHIIGIISHELAHMWFGDLVTMKWWSDLWLNEGFATYMSTKGMKYVDSERDKEGEIPASFLLSAMKQDQTINSHPIVQMVIQPNSEIFDSVTYDKGATVLRMLEGYMGEDFREGVSTYLKKYSFKNTVTKDLWDELSAASKQNLNVAALMDTWTKQMNHPFLTFERKDNSSNQFTIQQRRFLINPTTEVFAKTDSPFNYVWQIPLTYHTSESHEISHMFLNSSDKVTFSAPPAKWIKFNTNFTGYYLVNYDKKGWQIFIDELRNNHRVFSPSDRLNLLFDAFTLASAGYLGYEMPLNMSRYLKKENYHAVWKTALEELRHIKWLFRGDKETEKILLEYVRTLSKDLYKKYTWNEKDSDDYSDRKLRKILIKAACASENQDCLQTANRLFGEWMKGANLSSEIKEMVFVFGFRVRNNEEAWKFMWQRYLGESDLYEKKCILYALTTTANTTHLERLMNEAKNESQVRKHDYLSVMESIAQNPKGFALITRLIYNNWTHLVTTYGALDASFFASNVFSKYTSVRHLEQVRSFYQKNDRSKEGSKSRILAIEQINSNIKWIKNNRDYVKKWFDDNVYMPWRNVRLPNFTFPIRYDITLHPNLTKLTFVGEETIEFNLTEDTDYIVVHESGLNVTEAVVKSLDKGKDLSIDEVFPYKRNEVFVIRFKNTIPKGSYSLKLVFSGKFSSDGKGVGRYQYIHRETKEIRYLLATQFEATYARKVFPCFDEPAMKAKFRLSIIHDLAQSAVSNMPEEKREPVESNLVKTVFMESATMSTYILFFAVSDLESTEAFHKQTLVRVFAPADRLHETYHGLNLTMNLLKNFEEYFDVPYSLPKLDSVVIVNYSVPAMEHWGVISYNDKRFLVDENLSEYRRIVEIDRVIAHELVHQWFGNLVTMNWWNDLWLNEGLSTLIMYIPLKQYYAAAIDGVDVRKISRVMCVDSNTDSHPVVRRVTTPDEIANAFDAISYEKGSAVLKMLQYTLKDDFRKGLSNYLKRYAYRNAETEDLWRELSEASTEKINVSEIMSTWIDQMGFPYIELKRDGDSLAATQRWFVRDVNDTVAELIAAKPNYSPFGFVWQIPLIYKNLRTGEEHTLWLKEKNATFKIDAAKDDVIHFNPGFVGFYIVKYDLHDWARLGKRVLNNHTDFTATDRYSLLHDAFLLAETDRLIYDIPFEFTKYLKQEKEAMPWNLFRDQFLYFMSHLDPHSETANLLKLYVADLTSALYDEHIVPRTEQLKSSFKKWKSNIISCSYTVPDLDFLSIIIDLACRTLNEKCLQVLQNELRLWMAGQNITSDIHLIFELAVPRFGDGSLWEFLYTQMKESGTDHNRRNLMAEGLTSFRATLYIERTTDIMLNDPEIDTKLAKYMFQKLIDNIEAMPHLWNYTKNNWEFVMSRLNATDNASFWVSTFCQKFRTKEQLEDFSLFLQQVPHVSEYIVRGCNQDIRDAVEWSEKYEETINTWLVWNVRQ
ncbi:Glutamyl aminopeptidase like protein [Argiope bruennichi]|uniref:glutamyl aminopeptidase n=1 Tax=Argiope bruennichi TaxID=94029 RepID=A0A8T0E4H7_ARGBR|nr:Glutamyl aminopeptidase like protein [Argiope bruennichi]